MGFLVERKQDKKRDNPVLAKGCLVSVKIILSLIICGILEKQGQKLESSVVLVASISHKVKYCAKLSLVLLFNYETPPICSESFKIF